MTQKKQKLGDFIRQEICRRNDTQDHYASTIGVPVTTLKSCFARNAFPGHILDKIRTDLTNFKTNEELAGQYDFRFSRSRYSPPRRVNRSGEELREDIRPLAQIALKEFAPVLPGHDWFEDETKASRDRSIVPLKDVHDALAELLLLREGLRSNFQRLHDQGVNVRAFDALPKNKQETLLTALSYAA